MCHRAVGLDIPQAANLLTCHRDRATRLQKDIRMARRVGGEDDHLGITEEAARKWKEDWEAFRQQRVSIKKVLNMEEARHRKLSEMAQHRLEIQRP